MKASVFEITDQDDLSISEFGQLDWNDLVYISGQWISLTDMANLLITHKSVAKAQVAAVQDRECGKSLQAYVVLNEDFAPNDDLKKELAYYVRTHTNPCVRFKDIEFVTYIPPQL